MASNDEIVAILNKNHLETVQRLTRMETKMESLEGVPERVTSLEKRNSWFSGVTAAISAVFGAAIAILGLRK